MPAPLPKNIVRPAQLRRRCVIPLLILCSWPVGAVVAEDVPDVIAAVKTALPTGEEVLDRFIEVTGGQAAHAAIRNRVATGSLEFVGMGITAKVAGYYAEPRRIYVAMETEGLGLVEEGCDGTVVWSKSLMQGPQVLRGASRAFKLRASRFNADLHWREMYDRVACSGIEEVEGQACYKVIRYLADGSSATAYFAKDSGLLVRTNYVAATPMGDIPVEVVREGYRKVGGVRMAHREIVRTMGREQRMEYDRIRVNVKIAPDRFDLPDDIQLLARRYGGASRVATAAAAAGATKAPSAAEPTVVEEAAEIVDITSSDGG